MTAHGVHSHSCTQESWLHWNVAHRINISPLQKARTTPIHCLYPSHILLWPECRWDTDLELQGQVFSSIIKLNSKRRQAASHGWEILRLLIRIYPTPCRCSTALNLTPPLLINNTKRWSGSHSSYASCCLSQSYDSSVAQLLRVNCNVSRSISAAVLPVTALTVVNGFTITYFILGWQW